MIIGSKQSQYPQFLNGIHLTKQHRQAAPEYSHDLRYDREHRFEPCIAYPPVKNMQCGIGAPPRPSGNFEDLQFFSMFTIDSICTCWCCTCSTGICTKKIVPPEARPWLN